MLAVIRTVKEFLFKEKKNIPIKNIVLWSSNTFGQQLCEQIVTLYKSLLSYFLSVCRCESVDRAMPTIPTSRF